MKNKELKRYLRCKNIFLVIKVVMIMVLGYLLFKGISYYHKTSEDTVNIENTQLISDMPKYSNINELNRDRLNYLLITKHTKDLIYPDVFHIPGTKNVDQQGIIQLTDKVGFVKTSSKLGKQFKAKLHITKDLQLVKVYLTNNATIGYRKVSLKIKNAYRYVPQSVINNRIKYNKHQSQIYLTIIYIYLIIMIVMKIISYLILKILKKQLKLEGETIKDSYKYLIDQLPYEKQNSLYYAYSFTFLVYFFMFLELLTLIFYIVQDK